MSGVAVIRYLLANNGPVLAVVPAARIVAGDLPLNTVMPAIAVTHISGVPYNAIRTNETPKLHTDRVQVSALFKGPQGTPSGTGYPGVKALLKLVLAACPSQRGVINGVAVESIQPDTEGPDLSDQATALYSGSRDFIVRFTA
ncbi:MAG: hypothetical protein ABI790_02325 [Betaproteobacteria bacterium]